MVVPVSPLKLTQKSDKDIDCPPTVFNIEIEEELWNEMNGWNGNEISALFKIK